MDKVRVRYGIRTGFPFPNKGILVKNGISWQAFTRINTAVVALRVALREVGLKDWADALVWETS